jgi:hypothetical protein
MKSRTAGPFLLVGSIVGLMLFEGCGGHALSPAPQVLSSGIPYGFWNIPIPNLGTSPFNGTVIEESNPDNVIPELDAARAAHMRAFMRFVGGRANYQDPVTGCFSVALWEQHMAVHSSLNLKPYADDGTLMGNMMLDDLTNVDYWCGAPVPYSDVERIAQYSKQLFPYLPTAVRADMDYLRGKTDWVYLNIGWATYKASRGDPQEYIAHQVAEAQALRLGLVTGLNVLDGGNGESNIPGFTPGLWAMSSNEISSYGSALLTSSYVCDFLMWNWDPAYMTRADMQAAFVALSQKAAAHPASPCVVR